MALKDSLDAFGGLIAAKRNAQVANTSQPCAAYRSRNEIVCPRCGLTYDVNDDDPPICIRTQRPPLT